MSTEKCPLPLGGAFLYEDDIPHQCRECLEIVLDGESYINTNLSIIGVTTKLNHDDSVNTNTDCGHDMYYWVTGIAAVEVTVRKVELSAACDVCDTFVIQALSAVCNTES